MCTKLRVQLDYFISLSERLKDENQELRLIIDNMMHSRQQCIDMINEKIKEVHQPIRELRIGL